MTAPAAAPAPDVIVTNHGTIFTFDLLTAAARTWVDDHVAEPMWMGHTLCCEHRYAQDLAEGMQADGLVVV